MYATLERLYKNNKNKKLLENAVKKAWITAEDMEKIIKENEKE